MADTNRNINIDISGDTANMATDYGLSGVSLGDAHVGISKIVWGDHTEGNRVTLSNALPVLLTGSTGPIEIKGQIWGASGESVRTKNFVEMYSGGSYTAFNRNAVVGYNEQGGGHRTHFVAVAGNTSGRGYGAFIAVTGSVQGPVNNTDALPIRVTGGLDLRDSMVSQRGLYGTSGEGIIVQGGYAGLTATVAGEVYPGYGFGVPIAVTGGRRLGIMDVVTVTGSVDTDGGRTITSSTDSIKVFGHDGQNRILTTLKASEDGATAGFSGDALKVAIVNAAEGITFSIAVQQVMGVTNGDGTATHMPPLRIQGYTAGAGADPVIVRGENAGALEVYSTSGINANITNTSLDINDTDILNALQDPTQPILESLREIKMPAEFIPMIRTDITSGNLSASISEIQKPTALRSGTKQLRTTADALHQNLEIKSGVTVKADPNNNSNVLVGNSSLVNGDSNGYLLEPGESIFLEINNLNKVYAKSASSGPGTSRTQVYYLGS